jgi:hypothetical protein
MADMARLTGRKTPAFRPVGRLKRAPTSGMFDNRLRQATAPVAASDLPDFLHRTADALGSDPKLAVQEKPMAEEFCVPQPERRRSDRG